MVFLEIFVQKVFDKNLDFRYLEAIFFQISYSLVPKIEICLKYILDKISHKQPLCDTKKCILTQQLGPICPPKNKYKVHLSFIVLGDI